jgi:uncharacterized protein (DUF488 family)
LRSTAGVKEQQVPGHIWTIGHSKLSSVDLIRTLKAYEIDLVADVRRFPNSRKNPQFNQKELAVQLSKAGIGYAHFPDLGGRRRPGPDSHNTAWRNASFRGYADYMETADFSSAIDQLMEVAGSRRTAVMCAEAVWWRCHRRLISDYLSARGIEVTHILSESNSKPHSLTEGARIVEGKVHYPG